MWRNHFYYFVLACAALLWSSCANELNPQGGPRDTKAPELEARSMVDSTLHFKGGSIAFAFSEKIDPAKIQLTTNPLLITKPKIEVKGKLLQVIIADSTLEKNTTYQLNFGTSIQDITEGNALARLTYTFSTGASIDTLQLEGNVMDAATGKPDTTATVLLYTQQLSDSDICKLPPLYAAKVDANGFFVLPNLPQREFFLYAITDGNKNLKLDLPQEKLAFFPSAVLPLAPTKARIMLRTFSLYTDSNSAKTKNIFAGNIPSSGAPFAVNIDTLDKKKRSYDITQPITISFAKTITNWQPSRIRLYADSVLDATGVVSMDSANKKITMNVELAQDALYTLRILDSFAQEGSTFFKGNNYTFRTKQAADYGSLQIKVTTTESYPIYILLKLQDKIISKQKVTGASQKFDWLAPGTYDIYLLHDYNADGAWTTGNYFGEKKLPEYVELIAGGTAVKANWSNAIEWPAAKEKK